MHADYQLHGDVALITLNNPPVNGLGYETRVALMDALSQALADAAVQAIVTALGAKGPGDMGKVMGAVKTQLAGKADMGQVSAAVKAALAG